MQQAELFSTPLTDTPRSRRNDPPTSHLAAERVKASGKLAAHQIAIRQAIRRRPGMTYTEIAEATGLERHAVARRLKELEPRWVKRGEARSCGGRPLTTWWPIGGYTEKGQAG